MYNSKSTSQDKSDESNLNKIISKLSETRFFWKKDTMVDSSCTTSLFYTLYEWDQLDSQTEITKSINFQTLVVFAGEL